MAFCSVTSYLHFTFIDHYILVEGAIGVVIVW
jgi:hypothetical protein